MKASQIAEALRARDPGAPAALYDTHGESLFRYCWFIVRDRGAAQIALRDTLVLAEAHIEKLRDPEMLRTWLYALARADCLRRQESAPAASDVVIARPDQADADRRLIAWHAVASLDPAEREALELTIRHGMDAGQAARVMGLPAAGLRQILDESGPHLEHALAGELLARQGAYGGHGCQERAAALRGWAGQMTVPLRERLVKHAASCQACHRYLPRNVSAAKVYGLLPRPAPPQAMRPRVMASLSDPELGGYRMFTAGKLTGFDRDGFPSEDAHAAPVPAVPAVPAAGPVPRGRPRASTWAGPSAALGAVAMLTAGVIAVSGLGAFDSAKPGATQGGGEPMGATPAAGSVRVGSVRAGSVSARSSQGSHGPGDARGGESSPPAESVNAGGPERGQSAVPARVLRPGPVPGAVPLPHRWWRRQPGAHGRAARGFARRPRPRHRLIRPGHPDRQRRPGHLVGLHRLGRPHPEQRRREHPRGPAGPRHRDGKPGAGPIRPGQGHLRPPVTSGRSAPAGRPGAR